jgi:hypothetical protein
MRIKRKMQQKIETRVATFIEQEARLIAKQMGREYPSGNRDHDEEIEDRIINILLLNLLYGSESLK